MTTRRLPDKMRPSPEMIALAGRAAKRLANRAAAKTSAQTPTFAVGQTVALRGTAEIIFTIIALMPADETMEESVSVAWVEFGRLRMDMFRSAVFCAVPARPPRPPLDESRPF